MALVEVARPVPNAWGDLDWERPDLGDTRYLQALQSALAERFRTPIAKDSLAYLKRAWCATPSGTAHGVNHPSSVPLNSLRAMVQALGNLAGCFIVPWEHGNYKPDLSDFPKRWTRQSLFRAVGGEPLLPTQGVPLHECAEALRRLKEALSLLHLTPVNTSHAMCGIDSVVEGRRSEKTARAAFDNAIANAGERSWSLRAMRNGRYTISAFSTVGVFSYDIYEGEAREVRYDCDIRDEAFKVVRAYGGETLRPEVCLLCRAVRPENPEPDARISTVAYDDAGTGLEEGKVTELRFPHGTRDIVLHAPLAGLPFAGEPQRDAWVQEGDYEYLPLSYATRGFTATVCPHLDFRAAYRFQ